MATHEEVKRQATKERILDTINESRCNWPHCGELKESEVGLPAVLRLPDGRMKPIPDRAAKAGFCVYHGAIARECCAYGIKEELVPGQSDPEGNLMGPFEAIHMIESVLKAQQAWRDTHPGMPFPQVKLQEVPPPEDESPAGDAGNAGGAQ
jgi:hypothetical protein